ncbi:hypothetical protein CHUAL_013887 [Chamberlinius hualienensis]
MEDENTEKSCEQRDKEVEKEDDCEIRLELSKVNLDKTASIRKDDRKNQLPKKTAEDYAYESLASDLGDRITYDNREDLESWLEKNSPSIIQRNKENNIGWIQVTDPNIKVDFGDYELLTTEWNKLIGSGENITYKHIHTLAVNSEVKCGFWTVHVCTGVNYVDLIWKRVVHELIEGDLKNICFSVQVSPWCADQKQPCTHRIKIWNDDFTSDEVVMKIHDVLRKIGVRTVIRYKPNAYSSLMIYRNNEYNVIPSLIVSTFDLMKKSSVITRPNES